MEYKLFEIENRPNLIYILSLQFEKKIWYLFSDIVLVL